MKILVAPTGIELATGPRCATKGARQFTGLRKIYRKICDCNGGRTDRDLPRHLVLPHLFESYRFLRIKAKALTHSKEAFGRSFYQQQEAMGRALGTYYDHKYEVAFCPRCKEETPRIKYGIVYSKPQGEPHQKFLCKACHGSYRIPL
eukprot:g40627.t1